MDPTQRIKENGLFFTISTLHLFSLARYFSLCGLLMQQNKPIGVSHRIILNLTALCVIYFTKDAPSLAQQHSCSLHRL